MKARAVDAESQLAIRQQEIEQLRSDLYSTSQSNASTATSGDVARLQFDKDALESKMRKFVSHCQRLEDEKAAIGEIIRSTMYSGPLLLNDAQEMDIHKSVVSMCDRLTMLEEKHYSSDNVYRNITGLDEELEKMRKANATLAKEHSEATKNLVKLSTVVEENEKELKLLHKEETDLRTQLKNAQLSCNALESEKARQIHYLESENLQLMHDLKAVKKQMQTLKVDMNTLRSKSLDSEDTIELGRRHGFASVVKGSLRPPTHSSPDNSIPNSSPNNKLSVVRSLEGTGSRQPVSPVMVKTLKGPTYSGNKENDLNQKHSVHHHGSSSPVIMTLAEKDQASQSSTSMFPSQGRGEQSNFSISGPSTNKGRPPRVPSLVESLSSNDHEQTTQECRQS
jgi:uncharacterized protein (UPF0335 family)